MAGIFPWLGEAGGVLGRLLLGWTLVSLGAAGCWSLSAVALKRRRG
jgi:hypothetical protein